MVAVEKVDAMSRLPATYAPHGATQSCVTSGHAAALLQFDTPRLRRQDRRPVPRLAGKRPLARGQGQRRVEEDLRRRVRRRHAQSRSCPISSCPAQKPKTPKKQHQAEFGSPGNYFAEKTIGAVTSGGRSRAGQACKDAGRDREALRRAGRSGAGDLGPRIRLRRGEDPVRRLRGARHQGFHGDPQGDVPHRGDRRACHARAGSGRPQGDEVVLGRRARPAAIPADLVPRSMRSISTATARPTSGIRRRTRWPRSPTIWSTMAG